MTAGLAQLDIYKTAIPMRSFEHAAASRSLAEAVVVKLTLSDGRVGWGETLPRQYVTGESTESVITDLSETIWPAIRDIPFTPAHFAQAMQGISGQGNCINAACCAMDLAGVNCLFDEMGQIDYEFLSIISGRARLRGEIDSKVSGVLGTSNPDKTARQLRLMRLFGLRDFKLKLGLGSDVDYHNLRAVHRQIGKGVVAGKYTFRVDVNGGWDADTTPERIAELADYGVCLVEQPVYCSPGELVDLSRKCGLPLMADESLLTGDDAAVLSQHPKNVWWNIRLSKNGGFLRSLAIAIEAHNHGVQFVLGCMVGESGILSTAQRRFLQMSPVPRFVEGNFGRLLLRDDLTKKSPMFGYAGRLKTPKGSGFGFKIDELKLEIYGDLVLTLT